MKKYLISLKSYIAIMSSLTFLFITIFSSSLVALILWLFDIRLSLFFSIAIVCVLTTVLSTATFYFGTAYFLRYIERFNKASKRIGDGDFSVRVERNRDKFRGNFIYLHELDELADSTNKTVSELEKMNFLQKDFISNVSHELKTPLSVISGFCEILLDEPDEADRKRYLNLIHAEANALSELCENMLLLSKLDNNTIVPQNDVIRVDEQIRKALSALIQKHKSEHELELLLNPVSLKTNASMLMQVWINLLDNALKYSKSKICIECFEQNGEIVVRIKDDGEGIKPSKLERIYDKFYQCEESHKKKGSGLGLSIVRRILEHLKGEIDYKNTECGVQVSIKFKV